MQRERDERERESKKCTPLCIKNNNKFNNSYCSMKQYESFVISQGNDLRDGILIWFKAKYTNYIELVRGGENYIWLKLKNKNKDLSSNTQNIFLWTIYIPPIESPTSKPRETS